MPSMKRSRDDSPGLGVDSRIWVAGSEGMVGSAILRRLSIAGYHAVVGTNRRACDLTSPRAVEALLAQEQPEYVFLAAAKVGGIGANSAAPADFIRDNLCIQTNVIDACYRHQVKKLLVLGSSCIYPKLCPQPIREEALLSGPLEPTNEAYAVAKLAGITTCAAYNRQHGTNFICAMPCNLYGPGDRYDVELGHVVAAMVAKLVQAERAGAEVVTFWGDGSPRRELLHVDDLAAALLVLMREFDATPGAETALSEIIMNVGTGWDLEIRKLAAKLVRLTGYRGAIAWDTSQPNGTPRKVLDVRRVKRLGWSPSLSLDDGLADAVERYRATVQSER